MCGILGSFSFKNNVSKEDFIKSLNLLSLRGPDAHGIYENEKIILGQRRLSIIDTSEVANQPFYDHSNQYVIVFNGEIFNFKELKKQKLNKFNIEFKTNSDTEVLLYLLIHYGEECLNWLSGFFAFAFYSIHKKELLLVRDRFGKKPLHFYQDEEKIIFGSELKAIFPLIKNPTINPNAVSIYFRLNYLPPTLSILQNVKKLSPGTYLKISNDKIAEVQYYQTEISNAKYKNYNYEEAKNKIVELMSHSVQERMISDVPLGSFLSGGIDSSVVVAMASQFTNNLKTFSIGYKNNPIFDETKYANLVAKKYNTEHEVFYLEENDYKEEIFNVLDYLDEPFADSSAIPQYILCKKTKAKVTVALSGDGGDEVFAGYNKHKAEWLIRNNKLLELSAKIGSPIWKNLPQNKNSKIGNLARQLAKLAEGASLTPQKRYIQWCSILTPTQTNNLFCASFKQNFQLDFIQSIYDEYSKNIQTDEFNEVLLSDINLVLPGDMLHKVDMMSMANSLEVRSPFLDYKIVDFAFQLPTTYKIDNSLKKKIVQDAFRKYLPEELYNRPKQGFEIPLIEWFKTDFNDYIFNDLLEKSFIEQQQIFDYNEIINIKNKLHSSNPGNIQATIWALIVFQHWYKKYFY